MRALFWSFSHGENCGLIQPAPSLLKTHGIFKSLGCGLEGFEAGDAPNEWVIGFRMVWKLVPVTGDLELMRVG